MPLKFKYYQLIIKENMTPYRTPQEKSIPLLMVGLKKFLQKSLHRKNFRRHEEMSLNETKKQKG